MYEFGPFRLDPLERSLWKGGQVMALAPKGLDLLLVLVRNAGRVVDKEELMREVWRDTFVEENNLTVNISSLRKMLGNGSSDRHFIQTVPRRGYRFAASVRQSRESATGFAADRGLESRFGLAGGPRSRVARIGKVPAPGHRRIGALDLHHRRAGHRQNGSFERLFSPGAVRVSSLRLCRGRCLEQYGAGESYLPVLDSLSDLLSGPEHEFVADVLRSQAPTWCLQLRRFSAQTTR